MDQEPTASEGSIRRVPVSTWIAGGSILVLVLILIGYVFGKILWDWLELLIVPLVLALGGYWLNSAQDTRQDAIEERRAQDDALQSYLDHMSQLLIDKEGTQLQQLKPSDEVRSFMKARTTTALNFLDPPRKRIVIRYLAEANLISDETPIISLLGTDLRHLDLSGLDLSKSNLANADLRGADLGATNLRGADLHCADLSVPDHGTVTDLSGANLEFTYLNPADNGTITNLTSAILRNATLLDTNLESATLLYADLSNAKLTNKQEIQHELAEWKEFVNSPAAMTQQIPLPSKPELREAKGLTQEQINQARGNKTMELPAGLQHPPAWSESLHEQKGILTEQHGGR